MTRDRESYGPPALRSLLAHAARWTITARTIYVSQVRPYACPLCGTGFGRLSLHRLLDITGLDGRSLASTALGGFSAARGALVADLSPSHPLRAACRPASVLRWLNPLRPPGHFCAMSAFRVVGRTWLGASGVGCPSYRAQANEPRQQWPRHAALVISCWR